MNLKRANHFSGVICFSNWSKASSWICLAVLFIQPGRCRCGETLQEGDDVCKKLWGLPINFLLPSPLWSLYCNVQPPVRAGTAHCSVLMLQGDPKRLSQVFFSDKPKKIKKCNNPMLFKELLLGGFGILMFQKYHVCGNLPFGAFPI